jgi:hypothetical protein
MGSRSRRAAAAVTAATCAGGALLWTASTASADAAYEALARADGFELTISNPSIPTGIDIEGGGPGATAHQSSLGVRDADAQFPYAGQSVPGLPGTASALFGFPAPAYPFIAATNAGSRPAKVAYPGVRLEAESGDFTTRANALIGDTGSFGAESAAKVDEARNGDVTASASTSASGLDLGSYATLSDVRSVAEVVANGASGELTRYSTTSIGRISVPGLNITIPAQSPGAVPIPIPIPGVPNQDPIAFPPFPIPAGGTTLHDPDIGIQNGYFTVTQLEEGKPQTYLLPADAALKGFEAAGITITFQAPQKLDGGIISGTYRFTWTAPAPPDNEYYNGETKFTQTTGLVVANVDLQPIQDATDFGTSPGVAPAGLAASGLPAVTGADGVAAPGVLPVTAPGSAVPGTDTVTLSAQPGTGALAADGVDGTAGGADYIYLLAVLAAGVGLLATMAFSVLGVRS